MNGSLILSSSWARGVENDLLLPLFQLTTQQEEDR